ncbi:GGDEF domain-containing protein [Sporosarcina sp. CAU 1771]
MGYQGRFIAVGIVIGFNLLRYLYYHQYLGYRFEPSFFILTVIFLSVAWFGGRQYDLAKFYAEKDPLTNTYNRRTVDKVFKKLALNCDKQCQKLAIVLIDLDEFKNVNDQFGHQKGDELLKYIADIIRQNANKEDLIIRWGGDEFVHIAPNISKDFQLEYVQKLKRDLSQLSVGIFEAIDASIGISIYPDDGDNFEELVQLADKSMYEMKAKSDKVFEDSISLLV